MLPSSVPNQASSAAREGTILATTDRDRPAGDRREGTICYLAGRSVGRADPNVEKDTWPGTIKFTACLFRIGIWSDRGTATCTEFCSKYVYVLL